MNKILVLSFTIFVLISLSSSQSKTSLSNDQTNQLEFLFQLGDIQAKIWAVSMKVANNVTDSVARELKQIAEKIAPILTRFNITINATLSINPAQCKNDVKILLTQARNLFTTAPYKLETFKKFLNFVYVSLAQLILDCTGVNIITQIVNSPPVVAFSFNTPNVYDIDCGSQKIYQTQKIIKDIIQIISFENFDISSVYNFLLRLYPFIQRMYQTCYNGMIIPKPILDPEVTQDSCIRSIKNAKNVFNNLALSQKSTEKIYHWNDVFHIVSPILQQCKAFAKRL